MRNPNEVIEEEAHVWRTHRRSRRALWRIWTFTIAFGVTLAVYASINVFLKGSARNPYPFILLNLLPVDAGVGEAPRSS